MKEPIVSLRNISKHYHNLTVLDDFSIDIYPGEFLTLLGPSGCGKTTVLRIISGLENCDSGDVIINGINHNAVPASRRDVNTVFQSYALFPHMTVFENIAFGLKIKKKDARVIRSEVASALEMVKLDGYQDRRIHQLSGGQQQRVAIARAIVNKPLILLLDEPLSALDYRLRKEMRLELKHLHRRLGITFVFVTHDQEEALTMSDRVVVIDQGRIEQQGSPKSIYEEPVNLFVANFVGESNVFEARAESVSDDAMTVRIEGVPMIIKNTRNFNAGDSLKILLRPEDMKIERQVNGCPPPFLHGEIDELIYKGTTVDIIARLDSGKRVLTTEFFNEDSEDIYYAPGESVCISWVTGWEVVLPHA
ncbi:MAG: spermidine/putrescine ABC transporter ATP-binding protein PotA [Pseudomonadota bacterium]